MSRDAINRVSTLKCNTVQLVAFSHGTPQPPLKRGAIFPPFLRGARGDQALSEPYCIKMD